MSLHFWSILQFLEIVNTLFFQNSTILEHYSVVMKESKSHNPTAQKV